METRHFFAPDMRQAMKLIKSTLGKEAIIYSQRKVTGGIEIEAGLETLPEPEIVDKSAGQPTAVSKNTAPQSGENITEKVVPDPMLKNVQDELSLLRSMLENQLAGFAWQERGRRSPVETVLLKRLRELEIDTYTCEDIIKQVRLSGDVEESWIRVQQHLLNSIPTPDEELLSKGSIVALVGPTGVGKTTSIAKLAARYILRHGSNEVGLISTDSYRVAAIEQLQVYGQILNAPVLSANSSQELQHAIYKLQDKSVILIDTAGVGHRDKELTKKLSILNKTSHDVKTLLVLSANNQPGCLEQAIKTFQVSHLKGCILTKLDEANNLGHIISKLIKYKLPAYFISNGQRVPEDLQVAKPSALLNYALTLQQKYNHSLTDDELATSFSGEIAHA